MSGLEEIDERLRSDGDRKRELTVVDRIIGIGVDVDDVRKRSARQGRQQHLAGAVAVAVALVISAGAVTAAARSLVISDPPVARPPTVPTVTAAVDEPGAASTGFGTRAAGGGASTTIRPALPPTSGPAASSPSSTVPAPAAPSSTANPSVTAPGRGIRQADLARAVGDSSECDGPVHDEGPKRSDRATVSGIAYGNVVGDEGEDAVVTVSCSDSPVAVHASVYTLESAAPHGVRRVARVEPDTFTRGLLAKQEIGVWKLADVSVTGSTVESRWTGDRTSRSSGPPISFTLRQRWTGTSWLRTAPLQLSPTKR